jgi:tetratricopeptide (TPR) repeat protein
MALAQLGDAMRATIRSTWGAALLIAGTGLECRVAAAPMHPIAQLVHQKRYPEAAKAIAERLAADPKDANALSSSVDLALAQDPVGRLAEATSAAERCVAAHPDNSLCAEALGRVLSAPAGNGIFGSLGNARALHETLERAVRFDPTNYRARLSLQRYYLDMPFFLGGSPSRALELAMEVQRSDPDLARLMLALGAIKEDRHADAEQFILAASLAQYPLAEKVHRDLLFKLGAAHLDARRYADSARLFAELARRVPTCEHGQYGLGLVSRAQGRLAEAAGYLEKAAAIVPRPYVYKTLGEVHQAQNNTARAIAAYQAALAGRPALDVRQQAEVSSRLAELQQQR